MDEYANLIEKNLIEKFDRKNWIFVRDPHRKSGYIPVEFDLTKNYIKQFLSIFSPPDFNKFFHESIKHKIKTDPTLSIIGTRSKY